MWFSLYLICLSLSSSSSSYFIHVGHHSFLAKHSCAPAGCNPAQSHQRVKSKCIYLTQRATASNCLPAFLLGQVRSLSCDGVGRRHGDVTSACLSKSAVVLHSSFVGNGCQLFETAESKNPSVFRWCNDKLTNRQSKCHNTKANKHPRNSLDNITHAPM
jgi:hypothetical protein